MHFKSSSWQNHCHSLQPPVPSTPGLSVKVRCKPNWKPLLYPLCPQSIILLPTSLLLSVGVTRSLMGLPLLSWFNVSVPPSHSIHLDSIRFSAPISRTCTVQAWSLFCWCCLDNSYGLCHAKARTQFGRNVQYQLCSKSIIHPFHCCFRTFWYVPITV